MLDWQINMGPKVLKVYDYDTYHLGQSKATQIGKIQVGECFADGNASREAPWEGDGVPVCFINANHEMTFGVCYEDDFYDADIVSFAGHASNGTKWVETWYDDEPYKRKVKYETRAYYADGTGNIVLKPGSYVWLDEDVTRGQNNPSYCSVTKVQKKDGKVIEFVGNGFVDLTYGGKWLRASNCILRKA